MGSLRLLRPAGDEAVDGLAVLALTAIALVGFRSSYGGLAFFVLGLSFAAVGVVIAYTTSRLDVPLAMTVGVAIVVYAVVGGVAALPERAIAGSIPSPQSILVSLRMSITGWKDLITTAPPVGRTGDLMIVPVFAGMACGTGAYVMARRLKTVPLAIIPPVVLLALAIATGTNQPVSVVAQGIGFAVVAFGWLACREHRRRPSLGGVRVPRRRLFMGATMVVVASAAGYALAPRLPLADYSRRDIWRQTVTPPFDPREYPSPLAGYRKYVTAADRPGQEDPVVFSVEGLPVDVPVRLATMDTYDGLVWQVAAADPESPSLASSGSFERVGAAIAPDFAGETATITVTIHAYSDVWIPNVGEVIELTFSGGAGGPERDRKLAQQYRYNRSTDTSVTRLPLRAGDRYTMKVRIPEVMAELEKQEITPSVAHLGPIHSVSDITQKLVGPETLAINDTGRRLDRVRDLMVDFGTYSDGDRASGQVRARAGHSAQRLTSFVSDYPNTPLIGNAEQYASAYALLFRELDRVPTRVVMGFVPTTESTSGPVEVRASQVEAWVEVPLADEGWVAIFPTPPRDQTSLTSSTPQQPEPDYRTQNPPPPPLVDPEFDQPATAAGDAKPTNDGERDPLDVDGTDGPLVSGRNLAIAGLSASPVLTVAAGSLLVIGLKTRRRKRRRDVGTGYERIANGWLEVTDLSEDAGRSVPDTTTRREAAAFVGVGGDLAERADAAVWSGGQPDDMTVDVYWSDLVAQLQSMRSEMGLIDRFKTAVSLQSLKAERRRNKEARHG